jgi:hypothetical protein
MNLDQILNELTQVVKPVVQAIQSKEPTTQNYYREYMSAISVLLKYITGKEDTIAVRNKIILGIGVALNRAGANKAGVVSAVRAMGALD